MPFINVKTNLAIDDKLKESIKNKFGESIALIPGKTEHWLMVGIEDNLSLYFQGDDSPCCIVEIKVYGKSSSSAYEKLTEDITSFLSSALNLKADRIYVAYFETPYWGFAGSNF